MIDEAVAFGVVSIFGGFAYRLTGFGAAITMMTFWHVLNGLGMLHVSTELVAIQECITVMEIFLAVPLFMLYLDRIDVRFAAFVALTGALGGAAGTEMLLLFSHNAWFQRSIGCGMLACLVLQQLLTRPAQTSAYAKTGVRAMCVNAVVFVTAGAFGGFLGTPGPPLIVYTLLKNIERHEVIMYNAALFIGFNAYKVVTLIMRRVDDRRMLPMYTAVLIGVSIGAIVGHVAMAYVTQELFLEILRSFLLCFIAMSITVETRLEVYGRVSVFLVPLWLLFRRWRNLSMCHGQRRGWKRSDDLDGTGREALTAGRAREWDEALSDDDDDGGGAHAAHDGDKQRETRFAVEQYRRYMWAV